MRPGASASFTSPIRTGTSSASRNCCRHDPDLVNHRNYQRGFMLTTRMRCELLNWVAANQAERPAPTSLGEEVLGEIDDVINPNGGIGQRGCRRIVRPVND